MPEVAEVPSGPSIDSTPPCEFKKKKKNNGCVGAFGKPVGLTLTQRYLRFQATSQFTGSHSLKQSAIGVTALEAK
jgi:hypothetical protein